MNFYGTRDMKTLYLQVSVDTYQEGLKHANQAKCKDVWADEELDGELVDGAMPAWVKG